MRRTQIYLDSEQAEELARRARSIGVTKSSVIREAIETYLATPDEGDELARFRSALDAVGSRPAHLPDGEAYVEALRAADLDRDDELDAQRAASGQGKRR